jgi:hypothetical protein
MKVFRADLRPQSTRGGFAANYPYSLLSKDVIPGPKIKIKDVLVMICQISFQCFSCTSLAIRHKRYSHQVKKVKSRKF